MSGIGSIQGQSNWAAQRTRTEESTSSSRVRERETTSAQDDRMEAAINDRLTAAGVDAETQENLKTDLEQAFSDLFEDGETPSAEELKSTIDDVFEKYGLDAEEILGKRGGGPGGAPPQGPPPGGGPPPGASGSQDVGSTLLDSLTEDSDDEDEDSTTSSTTTSSSTPSAKELAERLMDLLAGFDQEA